MAFPAQDGEPEEQDISALLFSKAGYEFLWKRRVGEVHQIKRHLREPRSRGGVDESPLRIDRFACGSKAARAFAVRLTRDLDPQVGIQ